MIVIGELKREETQNKLLEAEADYQEWCRALEGLQTQTKAAMILGMASQWMPLLRRWRDDPMDNIDRLIKNVGDELLQMGLFHAPIRRSDLNWDEDPMFQMKPYQRAQATEVAQCNLPFWAHLLINGQDRELFAGNWPVFEGRKFAPLNELLPEQRPMREGSTLNGLTIISGPSGTGKSTLIKNLNKLMLSRKGLTYTYGHFSFEDDEESQKAQENRFQGKDLWQQIFEANPKPHDGHPGILCRSLGLTTATRHVLAYCAQELMHSPNGPHLLARAREEVRNASNSEFEERRLGLIFEMGHVEKELTGECTLFEALEEAVMAQQFNETNEEAVLSRRQFFLGWTDWGDKTTDQQRRMSLIEHELLAEQLNRGPESSSRVKGL